MYSCFFSQKRPAKSLIIFIQNVLHYTTVKVRHKTAFLVFMDANALEQIAHQKVAEICQKKNIQMTPEKVGLKSEPFQSPPSWKASLKIKFDFILDRIKKQEDGMGRNLSHIFQQLPTKIELPEYYKERVEQNFKNFQKLVLAQNFFENSAQSYKKANGSGQSSSSSKPNCRKWWISDHGRIHGRAHARF